MLAIHDDTSRALRLFYRRGLYIVGTLIDTFATAAREVPVLLGCVMTPPALHWIATRSWRNVDTPRTTYWSEKRSLLAMIVGG